MGLYKRKDSHMWWMSFRIDGRRILESTGTTNKKLAEKIHAKKLTEITEGRLNPKRIDGKKTFRDFAEQYLEWAGFQRSFRSKKGHIGQLMKDFGSLNLCDFSTMLVEKYQAKTLKNKRAPATVNRHVTALKHMFTKAVEWELVDEEVLKRVRRVKLFAENNKRLRYLSKEEAKALVAACSPHLMPIVITALNTGMRKEEILSLEWARHVDLRHGFILLDRTKNGERREVPINQVLKGVFQGLVRHINNPYVFTNNAGRRFRDLKRSFSSACSFERQKSEGESPGNCPQCGKEILRVAGINDFRFHDLRHTFASWLVMAGVDLTTVSRLLGHKSLTMTLRYSHLAPSHMVKAVAVLESL
ncbi:MAG: site-specific integrase [Deltaproteobacteria bacterium]|nr:site-specific integrase [Deltaproteobacteria bacterium]